MTCSTVRQFDEVSELDFVSRLVALLENRVKEGTVKTKNKGSSCIPDDTLPFANNNDIGQYIIN